MVYKDVAFYRGKEVKVEANESILIQIEGDRGGELPMFLPSYQMQSCFVCTLHDRVKEMRSKYPLFISDFWNDGPYVNGCLADGRTAATYCL